MVEEQKEEGEKKEEQKEGEAEEIVLKVDMHCAGCARKVERSLKGFEGVEEVKTDSKAKKVIVKGKAADPVKLCDRIQKKTGRKVELISPLRKPLEEEKKEDPKEPPKEEEKKEEPKPITVILKVTMHCEACAQVLQKRIKKMEGVESVVTDLAKDQVIVKGFVDPVNLVNNVYRRTRKQVSIVQDEEKKAEKEQEKKEEKGEEEKKEKEDDDTEKKSEAKKFEYWPYYYNKYYMDYTYYPPPPPTPPTDQMFSDENPNACSVM